MNAKELNEYFHQEKSYFSKSRNEWLPIEDMPFQQALFSHRKLMREYGTLYQDTPLYRSFIQKLCPSASEVRRQLAKYGKACHVVSEPGPLTKRTDETAVRSKFYNAAKHYERKKVTTHKVGTSAGSYMEATVPVKMREKKIPAKA